MPVTETVEVPEREEALLRDKVLPTNTDTTEGIQMGSSAHPALSSTSAPMYSSLVSNEDSILDLYVVGSEDQRRSVPFRQWIKLRGPRGEIVRIRSVFDDGAMVNAIDEEVFDKVKHRLVQLKPSGRMLRMADGRVVPSQGTWCGPVDIGGVVHEGTFEVFRSGKAWEALFGKPLLEAFDAVHSYREDTIVIPSHSGENVTITNLTSQTTAQPAVTTPPTEDIAVVADVLERRTAAERQAWRMENGLPVKKSRAERRLRRHIKLTRSRRTREGNGPNMHKDVQGDCHKFPPRAVPHTTPAADPILYTSSERTEDGDAVWLLDEAASADRETPVGAAQPDIPNVSDPSILTRKTDPHHQQTLAALLTVQ